MADYNLNVNNKNYKVDCEPDTPLLWVLRDKLGLTGTKYGCGKALCGSCTVIINGKATRSCMTRISSVEGKNILTIEGLSKNGLHPIQEAWIANDVPQCGYCQPGQIMSAVALLNENPHPSDEEINNAMQGNICRCGTYQRIKTAIKVASEKL